MTEGVESVPKWLGVLRNLSAVQTEQGVVVFDVPLGAYKLQVQDGGEIGSEIGAARPPQKISQHRILMAAVKGREVVCVSGKQRRVIARSWGGHHRDLLAERTL